MRFHSLQATSQALQPMHTLVSVKKPLRGGGSWYPASRAGSIGPKRLFLPAMVVSLRDRGVVVVLRVGAGHGPQVGGEDRLVGVGSSAAAVALDELADRRSPGAAAGQDVAGAGL